MRVRAEELDDDLALAHGLADDAGAVAMSRFRHALRERTKPDGSLVTDADEAVEDHLRAMLSVERPLDAVLGEERGQTGSAARRWFIDGIDGTISFARGGEDWGTLIALEVDGEVVVGICAQPVHGRRYWGVRGRGAYLRAGDGGERCLSVSTTGELAAAKSYVPPPEWARTEEERKVAGRLGRATLTSSPSNHPALEVADGGCEAALFFQVGPWDLAAPSIVVEEAGGRFSDLTGAHRFDTSVGVFSNGRVHEALLAALAPRDG